MKVVKRGEGGGGGVFLVFYFAFCVFPLPLYAGRECKYRPTYTMKRPPSLRQPNAR